MVQRQLRALGVCVGLVFGGNIAQAATIHVRPGDSFDKIEAAKAGDEVVIAPGTYQFRVDLENSGTEQQPIVIRAEDPSHPPVWDLSGKATRDWPGSSTAGDRGRGCWQARGDHYVISGIVFQGCQDQAGAAFRAVNVRDITLRNCVFRDSTNGVTGAADDYLIEFCEFDGNGQRFHEGDSAAHQLYVFGGTLTVRYSWFHDGPSGQNFHVRARDSVIEYNWFDPPGSYVGDLMTCEHFCGGTGDEPITQRMLLRGNVIVQGGASNSSQFIALFDDEDEAAADDTGKVSRMELTMTYNTVIGTRVQEGKTQRLVNLRNDTVDTYAVIDNNVLYHVRQVAEARDEQTDNWGVSGTNNWVELGTDVQGVSGSIVGKDPGFVDMAGQNFAPAQSSPLRGAAGPSEAGVPDKEYYRDAQVSRKYRLRANGDDIGAFGYGTGGEVFGPESTVAPEREPGELREQDDGGCGCRVAGQSSEGGRDLSIVVLLGLAGALVRRRRKMND